MNDILQPLSSLVISGAGVWIGWEQKQIARAKLRAEFYDRCYPVYQAARSFLSATLARGDADHETLRAFVLGTADAEFLLDKEAVSYLNHIYTLGCRLHEAIATANDRTLSEAQRQDKESTIVTITHDLLREHDLLPAKFKPYLQLGSPARRSGL